jgi:TolB-like protein/DNA-binding winged helix-turn-helix (wHTH) protein
LASSFRVGSWVVEPSLNIISSNGRTIRLEPKVMEVLVCLAQHAGESLSKEKLLQEVWPGTFVTDDALKRCILELRRVFADNPREPRVIQTIAKRGYRLVALVAPINGVDQDATESPCAFRPRAAGARVRKWWMVGLAGGLALPLVLLAVVNMGEIRGRVLVPRGVSTIHSLAVLPLQNLSADPTQEYLSDGITDALITDLAQTGSLKVISRTSSMQYKQTKKSLPEIAHELNVDGIIEGTLQRSGDRVRITAQLVQGASDKHLWASTYERDASDLFALERDVTSDIVRHVQARLGIQNKGPTQQSRPVNAKALEAYLQGSYHLYEQGRGFGDEEKRKAAEYFQHAIDADPNFAPAFVGVAQAHENLLIGSNSAVRMRAAERAVEIDPANSDARVVLGWVKWQPYLDWQGAEREFRRAIALNPNNANAHDGLAGLLGAMGRLDEALREGQIAQELDPNQDHLSDALWRRRDYDGTIAIQRMMLKRHPDDGYLHEYLFETYTVKGMHEEAIQEGQQALRLFGLSEAAARVQHAFTIAGYRGAIRQVATEFEDLQATKQAFLPGNLAHFYTILGEKDRAFYWLQQAYEHREMIGIDGGLYCMKTDPMYDPLRSDPRFKDLLRRMGLPQ